ncbi:hypothetical protein GMA8713_03530 [Grimontia marina]|uniref:Uncharacterized protein n=1 Tax=Grimontia marina TaxID=646534 RepID=A0A128FF60_9GAMM|nr:hypothetical protein GMA8713_03530 [Grimontia marina]
MLIVVRNAKPNHDFVKKRHGFQQRIGISEVGSGSEDKLILTGSE